MTDMHPLLIELGTEELPVKALPGLAQAFFDGVIAALDNRDGHWRPGSFVTAAIAIEQREVPVAAPFSAIQTVEGRKAVFVRTKDGFEKRDVVLGQRDGKDIEIT